MNPKPRIALATFLGLLWTASLARAADSIDLKPLVNEKTVLVTRFVPSKIKATAVPPWFEQTFKEAGLPEALSRNILDGAGNAARMAQRFVDILEKAGLTQAALVLNLDDRGLRSEPHVMLVGISADPEAITQQLKGLNRNIELVDLDGVSVWTLTGKPNYVSQITPADRPELLQKVANMDDAAGVVAFSFSDAAREMVKKDLPNSRDPMDWPMPISSVGNLISAHGRVDANDGPHAVITGEFKDVKLAQQFLESLMAMTSATKALQPSPMTVVGNTITIEARQPAFTAMAADLKPAMERAQIAALRVKSMSNIRQLLLATRMYANEHQGTPPQSLADLGPYLGSRDGKVPPMLLTNPQRPDLKDAGYVYVPALEQKFDHVNGPATRLAIYEAGDFGQGVNVGFWDGHVEFVRNKAKFEALLATAQPATAPAPVTPAP